MRGAYLTRLSLRAQRSNLGLRDCPAQTMSMIVRDILFALLLCALATAIALPVATAQTVSGETAAQPQAAQLPAYRPPLRGAPGGRVGGASRGTFLPAAPLPTIELLAPRDHAGLTANPAPSLYFFTSGPVAWPMRFTISAPGRPDPILEVAVPALDAAGIYAIDTARYGVRLDPGIVYTWSVSAILDPKRHARDIVASASVERRAEPGEVGASGAMTPALRAVLCARDGLWYDAVSAAVAAERFDGHAGLDALMTEVGLAEAAAYDRQASAKLGR
jgi:Domain of Unknown Function (DUF928)